MLLPLLAAASHHAADLAVAGLWQGALLLAVVALALRLLPSTSAALRSSVWAGSFALSIALPFLHASHPSATTSTPALHLASAWELPLALSWLALLLTRATRLAGESLRLRRIVRAAAPVPALPASLAPLLELGQRSMELCSSPAVDSPSVLGFRRPRLLLPERLLLSLTPSDLRQILLHEREHLLRHDDWINLLQRLSLVLFPLNPALLLIDRQLGAERELACDAAVIRNTAEPVAYARCLTSLAEHRLTLRSLALSLSSWSRRSELTRRVESLLRPARPHPHSRTRLSAAALVLLLVGGSAAITRAPRLVSFGDLPTPSPTELAAATMPTAAATIPIAAAPTTPAIAAPTPASATPAIAAVLATAPAALQLTPGAHAIAASYHAPSTLHLIPATLPTPRRHRAHLRRTLAQPASAATPSHPHTLLTATPAPALHRAASSSSSRPRAVLLTTEIPSYAAVPFADGWLIFQL